MNAVNSDVQYTNILTQDAQWWLTINIKTVNSLSLPSLLFLAISCYFRMPAPIDKCGNGPCAPQSPDPSHNGCLCPPHLPLVLP